MSRPFPRRQFLRGSGVSLALPLLESLVPRGLQAIVPPKRLLAAYVGHGFAITRKEDHPARRWSWYPRLIVPEGIEPGPARPSEDSRKAPKTQGRERMVWGDSMRGFNQFHDQTSVLYGLEHPRVTGANGHGTADSFLTGCAIGDAVQSPSIDQVAAARHGSKTRFPSLVLSNDGGLGSRGASKTLSYNAFGRPIPASNDIRRLYDGFFNSDPTLRISKERRLAGHKRLVDRVVDSYKSLRRNVGAEDSHQLDQYLDTLREVESEIERMQTWSATPKPDVDKEEFAFTATVNEPHAFIRTLYNLIYLAFRTDSTRYATYMLQNMGAGPWDEMPRVALGLGKNHHGLAHDAAGTGEKAMERLGTYDQFHSDLLTEFMGRLADTPEGSGTMLDNTLIYYGCSNSKTHVSRNYPLLIAGGNQMGFHHGQFHDFSQTKPPLSNLYVTLLDALDVEATSFSDSTGSLNSQLLSAAPAK